MDWDAVNHADYYLIRWRSANGGKLNAGMETESTNAVIAVADYGQWVVRLEACNDSGCGDPLAKKFRVKSGPPAVSAVQVASQPLSDSTYALDEVIRISVTFDKPVVVTGTPRLKIDMDPANWGEKWADYQRGSGADVLTFTHTVVEPNYSTQGISVVGNSLELNGGTIVSVAGGVAAELSHDGLGHNVSHKVDWQKSLSCELVAPTALAALGIEHGLAVHWQMPDASSTDDACEASGFVLEARDSSRTYAFALDDSDLRSMAARNLPAGKYDLSIRTDYRGTRSGPRNANNVNVPANCAVTLTLETPGEYEVSGTWTNAADEYGCEAGGVYVDWKKSSESEWKSSLYGVQGLHSGMKISEDVFQPFRLRPAWTQWSTTSACAPLTPGGIGRTTIDDSWMRTSPVVSDQAGGGVPW